MRILPRPGTQDEKRDSADKKCVRGGIKNHFPAAPKWMSFAHRAHGERGVDHGGVDVQSRCDGLKQFCNERWGVVKLSRARFVNEQTECLAAKDEPCGKCTACHQFWPAN